MLHTLIKQSQSHPMGSVGTCEKKDSELTLARLRKNQVCLLFCPKFTYNKGATRQLQEPDYTCAFPTLVFYKILDIREGQLIATRGWTTKMASR